MYEDKNRLDQCLNQRFDGLIWKIEVQAAGPLLAIETRNEESRDPLFSVFNFKSGAINFKEKSWPVPGNPVLVHLGPESMLLTGFEDDSSPQTKGITCIDPLTGEIRWQRFNISYHSANNGSVYVYDPRLQPRRYYTIDETSGETIDGENIVTEPAASLFPESGDVDSIPLSVSHGELAGEIISLKFNGKGFTCFHELMNGILQQRIIVYQDDTVLLDDILISGIQKLQPEAFFIHQNHLLYVRDKREIISYLV